MFSKFIKYEVGDGSKVSFWNDVWYGDVSYPDLFDITCSKDAWVADNMQW
jgi:hypothetical protein